MTDSSNASRPRVVLLTTQSIYGAEIINRLADEPGIGVAGVGFTDRIYKNKGFVAAVFTFLKRTGWRYVGYSALATNVAWSVLRVWRRPAGLPRARGAVRALHDVNAPETLDWLKSLAPDYI